MIATERFEQVAVASANELRAWLEAHHAQPASIWVVRGRKGQPAYVSREAVLDEVLCFGWIDGLARKLDETRTMQLLSPRRHARWAQTYKVRAARLIAEGRMRPPGLLAIAESRRLGLWDSLADVDALVVPDDLAAALMARSEARARFDAGPPSYRRNVLRWIALARTPATRGARIEQVAAAAAVDGRLPQM